MKRTWGTKCKGATGGFLAMGALVVILAMAMTLPSPARAASMTDYTWYPIFVGQQVPPNILFIVDFGNLTLQVAFSGAGQQYPISFCLNCPTNPTSTVTSNQYAANVTIAASVGSTGLVAVNNSGASIATATVSAPADTFDPTKQYYGLFDPFRCYTTNTTSFIYTPWDPTVPATVGVSGKPTVNAVCPATAWDGNFMNWLAMRKIDVIYQALVGGAPKPAQANANGTANSLAGANPTGENGASASTCAGNTKTCWRFVKFVPAATLTGRVPTTLPVDGYCAVVANGCTGGMFFGSGEGKLYVNDSTHALDLANPFLDANTSQYNIQVDLTTEPNFPAGTGLLSGTCNQLDPNFAGHLICYQKDRSLGLFQTMRTDAMRVAIMFVDAGGGNAGNMQFLFDQSFNSSSVTGIRNHAVQSHSPLSEALYEALCYYRKSQGLCYNNTPASYTSAVQVAGDAFWFANFSIVFLRAASASFTC